LSSQEDALKASGCARVSRTLSKVRRKIVQN